MAWEFQEILKVTDGRNRAPVARFKGLDGSSVDMILKIVGRQLAQRNLCCEYFGNLIAREMGINTPKPHILDLDQETVTTMNADTAIRSAGVIVPTGIAVGSEWFRPATAPGVSPKLSTLQAEEAARIYAFDLMLQQPDRLLRNPNILEIRGHFVAIDFETSCSFLWDILGDPAPWRVSKLPFVRDHFFRARLSPESLDWKALILAMLSIDLAQIAEAIPAMPSTWHDDCHHILEHIGKLRTRESDLVWDLIGTLTRPLT